MVLQTFVPYCFFFCVCMCVSDKPNRKLQEGEVMCETRFTKVYMLKRKSERE